MDVIDVFAIIVETLSIGALAYYCYNQHSLVLAKKARLNTERYLALHLQVELTKLFTLHQYSLEHKTPIDKHDEKIKKQLINVVAIINVMLDKCDHAQVNKETLHMLKTDIVGTLFEC